MQQLIKFKGKEYLLIGGAIATKEQYENRLISYAHLFDNGDIKRFNEVIGNKKDIKLIKKVKVNVKEVAWINMWDGISQMLYKTAKKKGIRVKKEWIKND